MDRRHGAKQEPELDQVCAILLNEVVERKTVVPNFAKAVPPHPSHQHKHRNAGPHKPRSEQKPYSRIQPGDVIVGVVPRLDDDVRKIDGMRFLPLAA